jgi:hypothetical protein
MLASRIVAWVVLLTLVVMLVDGELPRFAQTCMRDSSGATMLALLNARSTNGERADAEIAFQGRAIWAALGACLIGAAGVMLLRDDQPRLRFTGAALVLVGIASLVAYVSGTPLMIEASRRFYWDAHDSNYDRQLWEGFLRCAALAAPWALVLLSSLFVLARRRGARSIAIAVAVPFAALGLLGPEGGLLRLSLRLLGPFAAFLFVLESLQAAERKDEPLLSR